MEDRGKGGQSGAPAHRVVALHGGVQHHRQRPQVGGGAALVPRDALRRHEVGRTDVGAGGGEAGRLADRGDTEVGEDGSPVGPQQDVGGLHVAVLDAGVVRGGQRGQHSPAEPGRLGRWHRSPGQPVGERAAGDQLHHDPGVGAVAAVDDVVDGHDVRMVDPGQGPGLAQHALAEHPCAVGVVFGEVPVGRADLLDRHEPVQHQVPGPPDRAHPTAAEAGLQLEAPVDDSSSGASVCLTHGRELNCRRRHPSPVVCPRPM
ncbi:hypothetical protein ABIE67_008894 [Streptomyces sp. V4I8]